MSTRLKHKVIVVTGGASGIGRATVARLLEEGARVIFGDINLVGGSTFLEQVTTIVGPDRARFFPCDVGVEQEIVRLIDFARSEFGRIDSIVNNAGTAGALSPLIDTTTEDWDRTQQILLRGVFLGIKHAARAMIEQGAGGSIVNVASIAGLCGGNGGAAYSAAKAGVINLTRAAATQLGEHRIRVNAVSPGMILTPLLLRGGNDKSFREAATKFQPWPDPGEAQHIAPAISFLCSEDAQFLSGENVVIDGGLMASGIPLSAGINSLGSTISERIQAKGLTQFDPGSGAQAGRWQAPALTSDQLLTRAARQTHRTVVLSGVSKGLGLALAEKLIEMGHTVIGCARSAEPIAELQQRFGSPHRFDVVDVAEASAVRRWRESLETADLFPDLLISNAAVNHAPKQIWRFEPSEFERVLQTNLMGTVHLLHEFIPGMLRRKRGIIVNFSSGWGREACQRAAPYCASKWAVEGLTKSLSQELPPFMAAVSLHPGIVNTDAMSDSFEEAGQLYPDPRAWSEIAAPFILGITPKDNGAQLTVPGMGTFFGFGSFQIVRNLPDRIVS